MSQLPVGVVTLLFSDIEGSTRLLARLGPDYATALSVHRVELRSAWAAHGGRELGTEGDSFFVAFDDANLAVDAAIDAQRRLADAVFPRDERPRVRIGIHTGAPQAFDGGYVGMDVHRAARISAAAHGGQILVSETTADLVRSDSGAQLRDVGVHQLKDLPTPEHLFQVVGDDLNATDTVISLGAVAGLPTELNPLVGRASELADLTTAVLGTTRLITLTGPGGTGKTRLAIELARQVALSFKDGVYFVDLAAVTTEAPMWATIADALGLPSDSKSPPGFFEHVRGLRALLVLDNLEQIDGGWNVVSAILDQAADMVIVATSRRPLHLRGELEYAIGGLHVPDEHADPEVARSAGAVQLFVQHTLLVKPSFELRDDDIAATVEICGRLDGVPLAIELAASRGRLLSPQRILLQLGSALDLTSTDVDRPDRQRTVRSTIDWSYQLLTSVQQLFLNRLSVFAGGADLDAVSAVAADGLGRDPLDLVTDLLDASLLTINDGPDGEPRVDLLVTIKDYAAEQHLLRGTDPDDLQLRHARYFQQRALALVPTYLHEATMRERQWFQVNRANFDEALAWSISGGASRDHAHEITSSERYEIGLSLCSTLWRGLWRFESYSEAWPWITRLLELSAGLTVLDRAIWLVRRAEYDLVETEAKFADIGEAEQIATLHGSDEVLIEALHQRASATTDVGEKRRLRERALAMARHIGSPIQIATSLAFISTSKVAQGDLDGAEQDLRNAIDVSRRANEHDLVRLWTVDLADVQVRRGKAQAAVARLAEIVPETVAYGHTLWILYTAEAAAAALGGLGDDVAATRLLGACDAKRSRFDMERIEYETESIDRARNHARDALGNRYDAVYRDGQDARIEDLLLEFAAGVAK